MKLYDTVIVGGGPAGLSAALSLGIARKQILLCDDSAPRNSPATHIHNFVTRDGSSPSEFRKFVLGEADEKTLIAAGVRIETTPIARLVSQDNHLTSVELTNGTRIGCDALFAHPPQRQGQLVRDLGLALDEHGYVQIDPMRRETSVAGIYAAGDLQTRQQSAIFAAAAGVQAAAMLNMELTSELALSGVI